MQGLCSLTDALLARRWVRFGLAGGAATVSYYLLGLLFVSFLKLPLLFGNFLAYAISFIVSYLAQSKWTFAAKGSHAAMLPRFAVTQAFGLAINSGIIEICAKFGLSYEISMIIAIVVVPILVYLLCKYWVFKISAQRSHDA